MAHIRKMKVEDWIKVQDNPIQRDTERHAARARHLRTYHPTHSVVHAAELPSGKMVKLDGHTRALLWKRGEVKQPIQLTVVTYSVKDMEEAEQLYRDFDSKDALETNRDKVSGAYNKHNFNPQSALLQMGSIVQALRFAYGVQLGGTIKTAIAGGAHYQGEKTKDRRTEKQIAVASADIYSMINEFSYELHALDAFGLRQGQITSGVMAAFIISYRRYGHRVTPFWQGVFAGQGSKIGGQMDGIQAICEMLLEGKGKNRTGKQQIADLAARSLMAVEKWLKEELMFQRPRPLDTTGYLVGYEKPGERLIKAADVKPSRRLKDHKAAVA